MFELSQGLNVALRGTEIAGIERRETRSVEAYESFARGMMNLRLASRDSIERAIAAFEQATRYDPEYVNAWAALGGAYGLKGSFLSLSELVDRAEEIERRAIALDPDFSDAHMWLGTALLQKGRTDDAIAEISEAIRLDGENGQAYQALARALWVGKGDFAGAIPLFEKSIQLNPEAGYSYLQLGLLLAWEGQFERAEEVCRRAVELQDQYVSGNAGLQVVGANSRLGYVFYLQGRHDEALREYERGLAFVGSTDHALKDRTVIEINMKMGAAHHRLGHAAEAARHFDRALKMHGALTARGADDPFTRYYIAAVHALRGEADKALDSLERVAARYPRLTSARLRRDPDMESLRGNERFARLTAE